MFFLFFLFLISLCFVTHIDVGRIKGRRRRNKEARLTPLVFRGCADSCGGTVYTAQEGEQQVYELNKNIYRQRVELDFYPFCVLFVNIAARPHHVYKIHSQDFFFCICVAGRCVCSISSPILFYTTLH